MFWNLPLTHTSSLTCSCTNPSAAQWAKEKQRLSAGSNQETWRVTDIDGRLVVDVVRQAIAVSGTTAPAERTALLEHDSRQA